MRVPHSSYDRFQHCQLILDLIYGDILAEKVIGDFLGLIFCPEAFLYLPMIISLEAAAFGCGFGE